MRLLFQSDSQADFSNLDLCEQSFQELYAAATKHDPDAVIHAGDLKDAYNPIDVRVAKFWIRVVRKFKKANRRFIILLGNHDRISQSRESRNWLDILGAAGAEVVSLPQVLEVGNGHVAFIPYTSDKKLACEWAKRLVKYRLPKDPGPKVLAFHLGIVGASMGAIKCTDGLTLEDIQADSYTACFGGHFHEWQRVGDNCWYIGSPFCQDWGEADQPKGNLLVDIDDREAYRLSCPKFTIRVVICNEKIIDVAPIARKFIGQPLANLANWARTFGKMDLSWLGNSGVTVKQLPTKIPGWYNAYYLEESGITPEPGAYIRSKVEASSKKLTEKLREEEQRLKKLFPGCRYLVKHQLVDPSELEVNVSGNTDKERVEQYIASTITEDTVFLPEQGVSYILSKLKETGYASASRQIRVISARVHNILSFQDEFKVKYAKRGLVLLRGINRDNPKRSNGAGKTNFLSLLPVLWCGETLKGQTNDGWANERNEDPAWGKLSLRDEANRLIQITRSRRKHSISLIIDGDDQSSGLTGKEKKGGTQGLIEQVTGYDLKMLKNAVYIDQTVANGFVFGTQKDRMDLINKFLSLERFEAAMKLVGEDQKKHERLSMQLRSQIETLESDIAAWEDDFRSSKTFIVHDWSDKLKALNKKISELVTEHASVANLKDTYDEKKERRHELAVDRRSQETRRVDLLGKCSFWRLKLENGEKLNKQGKCGTCGQDTTTVSDEMIRQAQVELKEYSAKATQTGASIEKLTVKIEAIDEAIGRWEDRVFNAEQALASARRELASVQSSAKLEEENNLRFAARRAKLASKIQEAKRVLKATLSQLKQLDIDAALYEYARKAFSRSGLPLYLSASLCPVLNKAAIEYAELFFGGSIQVHFAVVDGEFQVEIINPNGSGKAEGQSVGESAMAGSVAAFSLREIAPKTNLLVLDEPGHGLDPEGARQFANGLLKLKDKFETIIVVTHSPVIESVLSGETTWTIEKKNGISRFIE